MINQITIKMAGNANMSKKSITYDPIITFDQAYERWNVPSKTHEGHSYAIRRDPCTEELTCSCVWGRRLYKKTGKPCVHIEKVMEWIKNNEKNRKLPYLI